MPGKSDANTYGYSDCYSHTYTHGNSTSTCAKAAAHAVPSTDALRMVGSKVKSDHAETRACFRSG